MLYLTYSTKEKQFKITQLRTKSVACYGTHHHFNDEDVDYAKSYAEIANSNLAADKLKIKYCSECHQPFADEASSILSKCPWHTDFGQAITQVEGRT